ncbi:MAG: tetratricopeptide repeat protein [Byssovorax sp.]
MPDPNDRRGPSPGAPPPAPPAGTPPAIAPAPPRPTVVDEGRAEAASGPPRPPPLRKSTLIGGTPAPVLGGAPRPAEAPPSPLAGSTRATPALPGSPPRVAAPPPPRRASGTFPGGTPVGAAGAVGARPPPPAPPAPPPPPPPPPVAPRASQPSQALPPDPPTLATPAPLATQLKLRADQLRESDPIGAARALVELGVHEERIAQDRAAARAAFDAAAALVPALPPALPRIRRLLEGRADLARALGLLGDEITLAEQPSTKADLLAERARIEAALGHAAESRAAYHEALRLHPRHAASLRGLEAVLRREVAASGDRALAGELALHLERLAEAYAPPIEGSVAGDGDARLSAWILVERAVVLDRRLGQPDLALAALDRAASFEPAPGPVRDALTRHLIRHRETTRLVASWAVEAEHERDGDRAARLLYAAARHLVDKLGFGATGEDVRGQRLSLTVEAIERLTRASARVPAGSPALGPIAAELIHLLETTGDQEAASAVREKRLSLLTDPEQIGHEHVRLSEILDALGRADEAAAHAERALEIDPDDDITRDRLDRLLHRLGRHDQRVRAWVKEASAERAPAARAAALRRASEIAERQLRRRDDAILHLRAAWTIDPGNAAIFDALSALLAPPARDPESDGRGVRARLDLYRQAAEAEVDRERRIGLLEKLASIWEDELGQPARAMAEIEAILALDPTRRSAILALQRSAERAGDARKLSRALQAEADLTADPALRRSLLLRAADVMADRLGDRERAMALVERALALDPANAEALRARYRLQDKASRYDDARRTMMALIGREPDEARRYALWLEVAVLDEERRKQPQDAVEAYRQAALLRPKSPLPQQEIVRLLRDTGEPQKLVDALMQLAATATDAADYARFLAHAAEIHELMLGDDASALKCLLQADGLGPNITPDPAWIESIERIYVRRGQGPELASLYARWLERAPSVTMDHNVRIALAEVLGETKPADAGKLLEGLLGVVPGHIPALRMLEQIERAPGREAALAGVLRAEAEIFGSTLGRAGALWELCALEEQIGASAALDAFLRLTDGAPGDTAALDGLIRVAGKLVTGVNLPHPAAIAARARLTAAVRARKELTLDPIGRALWAIEEALLTEVQAPDDPAAIRAALDGYHAALGLWPESLLAARGMERLAERVGDRRRLIESQVLLGKLALDRREKARLLIRAAELLAEDPDPRSQAEALALHEEALAADPDAVPAIQSLARMLAGDVARLLDRLGDALGRARRPEAVILAGMEMGRAILRQRDALAQGPALAGAAAPPEPSDPGLGIGAMRRVLALVPDDIPALLQMARLLVAQRVWAEARDTLVHIVNLGAPADAAVAAHFMLADVHEAGLADLAEAQASLQAVLAIDDQNRTALERLHNVALARGDRALAIQALGRLAEVSLDPAARVEVDLRLAEVCREAGDAAGRARAYCDAIAAAPNDARAWTALARLYRVETEPGASAYAQALQQVIDIASARRLPLDHRWLSTLGMLEVQILVRPREGVAHLQQAVALPGAPAEARIALARGLEAAGRNAEAVQLLRDVLVPDGELFARLGGLEAALNTLDAALAKEGRVDERAPVEEVRACLGDVKPERLARLRARRLPEGAPYAGALAATDLVRLLLPEARTAMIEVAVAMAPIAAKVLRFELSNLGIGSRDRLGPRDGHPTRMLADRIAHGLGIESFELYLSPVWQGAIRVYPGDPPALIGATSFAELPEPEQAFALGRLLTRVALGLAWLDEVPVEAMDGFLIASVRAVEMLFGSGELSAAREGMAQSFAAPVQRAIGRRQRKQIEEILPALSAAYDPRVFSIGVRRSEYRVGYLLAGDVIAAVDYLKRFDREIGRAEADPRVLLQHPVTNELLRYALSPESFAERRRAGTQVG